MIANLEGYVALIAVLALGLLLGKIKILGTTLDVAGVLFVAIFLGYLGVTIPKDFLKFGLVLFIFIVGMQSGPGFIESFKREGRQMLILTSIILIITALFAFGFYKIFHLNKAINIGVFTGAVTSTPGLAVAIEATGSPKASIGYGIAYPIGLFGLIILLNLLPRIFKIDLQEEKKRYQQQLLHDYPPTYGQNFRIDNPNLEGKTLRELQIREITGGVISRVKHGNESFTPTANTVLHKGDIIRFVGNDQSQKKASLIFGQPVEQTIQLPGSYDIRWMMVTNRDIINKKFKDLRLSDKFSVRIVKIKRAGIEIIPNPNSTFRFGDKILVAGTKHDLDNVASIIGNDMKKLSQVDFIPIFLGLLLGILLANIQIPLGEVKIRLGITGGALLSGLVLSSIGKTGPILWTVPANGGNVLKKLALLLFIAVVGADAGAHVTDILSRNGLILMGEALVLIIIAVMTGALIGWKVMKINFLSLLGLLTGALTSTAALGVIQEKNDCSAISLAYAATYPFALVLVIILVQLLSLA